MGEHRFACMECGAVFDTQTKGRDRNRLEAHWRRHKHGPVTVQDDAIDRAKFVLLSSPNKTEEG